MNIFNLRKHKHLIYGKHEFLIYDNHKQLIYLKQNIHENMKEMEIIYIIFTDLQGAIVRTARF